VCPETESKENSASQDTLLFSEKAHQEQKVGAPAYLRLAYAIFLLLSMFGLLAGCAKHNVPVTAREIPSPPTPPPPKARVAIIIDDVGYNERALPDAIALTVPVDFAVLPHLPYTQRLAKRLSRAGFEIMLHQPMEPVSHTMDPGPGSIGAEMTREQIKATLAENLQQVPAARGANNHMGSKATASRRLMEIVLPILAQRGLFFVDSLTTSRSVCWQVSKDLGIPIVARDVFLDNVRNREPIIAQLQKLKRLALRRGEAIGIGHFHPVTLLTLEEIAPSFEEEGIEFVFVSEIIRRRQESKTAGDGQH